MKTKGKKCMPAKNDGNAVRVSSGADLAKKDKEETREAKIARIKSEVQQGTYSVDSREVAKSIVDKTVESSKE